MALVGLSLAGTAWAQSVAPASKPVCVDAEVDGVRTLSYGCLSRELAPTPIAGGAASQTAAEALVRGPSNQVGTFNLSGEQNRFGANWGKSVAPQRPPAQQVVPPR
ncbi:hypothetical protein F6X42_30585 [Paraburkholderia sp. WC7.3b]|uniref:Uncharacterized protein n=1 Tax=Paraburkholderia podalyriae TaxID=1938811 RepID=A0ABR7PWW3_9BURK|nr:hypothetical protein [Paraburkholderia podalyriae]